MPSTSRPPRPGEVTILRLRDDIADAELIDLAGTGGRRSVRGSENHGREACPHIDSGLVRRLFGECGNGGAAVDQHAAIDAVD